MENFILNGNPTGDIASALVECGFDTNVLRPYKGTDGRTYITRNVGGKAKAVPVANADATLRKDDWILLDDAIVKAAKARLRAVDDLRARGLTFNIPNGMSRTVLQTERQSDISDAGVSMDGLTETEADRPVFDLTNLPLPIVHKDFHFSARQIAASRNGGSPLDTSTAELAARRVAEQVEKMLIGTANDYSFADGTIQGYTSFTDRITKTDITDPSSSGWSPADTLQEVLEMRKESQDAYHYGPYVLYCGPDWGVYMDDDYSANKGSNTLRQRIESIGSIESVRTLDYLTGYDLVLVQMTSDVVRLVNGMDIQTVQWDTHGGLRKNFKVMAIMVPQLRSDHNANTGIVHGTTS